jgi:arylsulfatase A-like enzyme
VARALAIAAAALALACGGETPGPARGVVLISIDTLRPDHLGAYGYPRATSPTLDRLAAEGVLFEVAVSTSPWTLPAHASLFTGLHPHRHGVRTDRQRLAPGAQTLAALLQRVGFDTAAVVNHLFVGRRHGLDQGFDFFRRVPEPGALPSAVADQALAWLDGRADDPDPFFLFLHFYDVHSDYEARASSEALFASDYDGPLDGSTDQLLEVIAGEREIGERDARHLVDLYDAGVRQTDGEIARIVARLAERGGLDRVLLVVTSDHGEEFLEHGGVLHARTHYEELLRIPLILRGPGIPAGVRVGEPVSIVDVAPTLLAQLGIAGDPSDGRDLSPLWSGDAGAAGERFVYADGDRSNALENELASIRGPRFKLIHDRVGGGNALFDLSEDPGEQRNRAAEQPERAAALERQLREFLTAGGSDAPSAAPLSPDEAARLRALGYGTP